MSGDRSKRMPPSGGRATTEDNFADCGRFADHVRAVYDAAMAYMSAVDALSPSQRTGRNLFQEQADAEARRQEMLAVCRRAKEGR